MLKRVAAWMVVLGLALHGLGSLWAEEGSSSEGGKGREPFKGGAGGEGGSGGGDGGAGGDGQVIQAPKVSAEQLKAAEAAMTAEQKTMFAEFIELTTLQTIRSGQMSFEALQKNCAKAGFKIQKETDLVRLMQKEHLEWIAAEPPEEQKRYWNEFPKQLLALKKQLDPLFLSAEEKSAAAKLAPQAAEEIKALLSDDTEAFLAARKKVLALGPACKALVAEAARGIPENSYKRLRFNSMLFELEQDTQARTERAIRIAEEAFRRAEEFRKNPKTGESAKVAVLVAGEIGGSLQNRDPAYSNLGYFSFPWSKNEYGQSPVSLAFGFHKGYYKGVDHFDTNMYGGQNNRIQDLGAVDLSSVQKAPSAAVTATWKATPWCHGIPVLKGHVYVEHCLESRNSIDQTFKFKVLELKPGEWVILEWAPVPQDK